MKHVRAKRGPILKRPFFEMDEIEEICTSELRAAGLFPDLPSPIRIERFIEKRFGVTPEYVSIPDGVLGYTAFSKKGVDSMYISAELDEDKSTGSQRRARSTLAHEAGHGLLHAHLFMGVSGHDLFEGHQPDGQKILCREVAGVSGQGYDGQWWEFQANKAMAALLLPKELVHRVIQPLRSLLDDSPMLPADRKADAIRILSETFDVNPIMAELRMKDLKI